MTTHTPGPWTHHAGAYFDTITAANGTVIVSAEIDAANAPLIAAAPELLAALKAVTYELGTICNRRLTTDEQIALEAARAVIAKAEGRANG